MTRETMMEKISKTLKKGETVTVAVAHSGSWNGADIYSITSEGFKHTGHEWMCRGTLVYTYSKRVLGK